MKQWSITLLRSGGRGLLRGAIAGLIAAVALIALVLLSGGREGNIGASYLAAFFGWPITNLLLLSEPLRWIRYWKEFVLLALVLNWAWIGAAMGVLAATLRPRPAE